MVRFKKIGPKRRVDLVAGHLRKAIVDGRVKAGEYLPPEREMARQFGVARLVIREALRTLESAGFVEIRRGVKGGCLVRESTPTHLSRSFTNMLNRGRITLRDLLEFRLGIEGEILRLAIQKASDSDIAKMAQNVEQTKALVANGSSALLRDKVHEFHILLANASKNPLYILIEYSIVDIMSEYMKALHYRSIVSRNTLREHEEILQRLKDRDVSKALSAVHAHIKKDNARVSTRAARRKVTYIQYVPW